LIPAGAKRFAAEAPWDIVNSPIDIAINGVTAEVVNQIGWPGSTDTYRVDFRVPPGIASGSAKLQLTAAWIPAQEVRIEIRR
jgi:uncharacterized protein (TIGR03437 family)